MKQTRFTIAVVASGILWGIISIFIRGMNSANLTPVQMLQMRTLFAAIIMFIFILWVDKEQLKLDLHDIWMFLGSGVVSLTFFSLCYFQTILEVGASVAVILLYTSPIFIILLAFLLFKEKITPVKITALVMTFAGCILVSGIGSGNGAMTLKGFLIGLGSGFGYGLYSIFSRFALRKYSALTITFYTFLFSCLSVIPFSGIGQMMSGFQISSLLYGIGIAFFCTVLPYILYTYGMTRIETGKAAILVTVEPLVGTLAGCCLWGESMTIVKAAGIFLIFSAVILLGIKK